MLLFSAAAYASNSDPYYSELSQLYNDYPVNGETVFTSGDNSVITDDEEYTVLTAAAFSTDTGFYVPASDIYELFPEIDSPVELYSSETMNIDGTDFINLECDAEALGLSAERNSDILTVTDPFDSARLLALDLPENTYTGAAKELISPYGLCVLQYETRSEAVEAYERLRSIGNAIIVPDIQIELAEDESSGYSSWGTGFIHSDTMIDSLYTRYGSAENMPEIKVAVIDSGIDDDHPALAGRILPELGYDLANNDSDTDDDHGHGTHVAGIICANSSENVKLIPFKAVSKSGKGSFSALTAALEMAVNAGADVINFSLGIYSTSDDNYRKMLEYTELLEENKIIAVAAAGNNSADVSYSVPASIDYYITVSACDTNGNFDSSYSNYGESVDICAPGTSIYSTLPDGKYGYKSGTSMACPFVSAAAAMLKTANPDIDCEEASYILSKTARDAGAPGSDIYYGNGLMDLRTAAMLVNVPNEFALSVSGTRIGVTLNILYNQFADCTLSAATYKNGILNDVSSKDGVSLSVDAANSDTLKIFMFDNMDNLSPIHDMIKVNIKQN